MATRVVHVRSREWADAVAAGNAKYIGRAVYPEFPASPYANQFKIPKDGTREEVIARYRAHMTTWSADKQATAKRELRGRVLGCWCKPGHDCHGDVLVGLVDADD